VEADVKAAAAKALTELGPIQVLVNGAAGYDPNGTVLDLTLEQWNRVFAVNVGGAFLMSREILPSMIAAGGGSIIHIASQLGSVAAPKRAVYCSTKGALIQRSGWCGALATWRARGASRGRSISSVASGSRGRSQRPPSSSPATPRAS